MNRFIAFRSLLTRKSQHRFTYVPSLRRRHIHSTKGLHIHTTPNNQSDVTPLHKILHGSIQTKGPIPVSEYMHMCLSHPIEGYYMKGDPIGARGDFITSPEISQLFGELVGIWLVSQWLEHAHGRPIRVVELGPGKGTLMDDLLRTLGSIQQTRERIQSVHLVETSARLQEQQKSRLGARVPDSVLHWHDRIEDIPANEDTFTMVVAHEFFDAIPIHVIEKTPQGFQQVLVDIDRTAETLTTSSQLSTNSPEPNPPFPGFRYILSGSFSPIAHALGKSSLRFNKVPDGSRIEVSPASWAIARVIGELIGPGGAGLFIDYGDDRAFGSSFRAFQKHAIVDVFHQPGMCDLTANVDFAYLKEAIASTSSMPWGPITQKSFLTKMGALVRLQKLLEGVEDKEKRERFIKGTQRLVDPLGMGTQYKVLGITSGSGPVYPFDP